MIAETSSFTIEGINAREVQIEVDVHRGLPNFQIIGMPDQAVRESRERVRAAMVNTGFEFPLRRITANINPVDIRKAGPGLDLALAAGVLVASGEITGDGLENFDLTGELALDGRLRPVRGVIAMVEAARERGSKGIIVPPGNGAEAALVDGITVRTIEHLGQLRTFGVDGDYGDTPTPAKVDDPDTLPDLADLRGQDHLCHALEVAAAGGHSMLMVGPPGSGKSLAARRLPSILPPLTGEEMLEVARIQSVSGLHPVGVSTRRPFRAPHHTVSAAGLLGSGAPSRLGEVSLAHRGVLFLDEVVEFSRVALEAMRQPIEEGEVTIARAAGRWTYPARFQLIAAANPTACGVKEGDENCRCSEASIRRYQAALDGVLARQIHLHVTMDQPDAAALTGEPGESSATVRERVIAARERMSHRLDRNHANADADPVEVSRFNLTYDAKAEITRSGLVSNREGVVAIKVARTLADLADSPAVEGQHVVAALDLVRRVKPLFA